MSNISRRGFARIIAFSLAVITALTIKVYAGGEDAGANRRALENCYSRSVSDLSRYLENIKNTLTKGLYSNSHEIMNELSIRLLNDAVSAKSCISQLPVSEAEMSNVFKFLSQVGNYSKSLSTRAANGEQLTEEDRENLAKLLACAEAFSEGISGGADLPQNIADCFKDIERVFDDYPTLIYDGAFSDHLLQSADKTALMLENKPEIDIVSAHEFAVSASANAEISLAFEEAGKMPSYVFSDGNITVSVTKAGGYLSYMLDYRALDSERISHSQAAEAAKRFIDKFGMAGEVISTGYETLDGICIVSFAAVEDDIVLYPDLIKVGVSLDLGEIVSYDARQYLLNHNPAGRGLREPLLSETEAKASLSPLLITENARLCVIPAFNGGMREIFCYEFLCKAEQNQQDGQILVYINADTGKEEQIFLVETDGRSFLTI